LEVLFLVLLDRSAVLLANLVLAVVGCVVVQCMAVAFAESVVCVDMVNAVVAYLVMQQDGDGINSKNQRALSKNLSVCKLRGLKF
jgi:hypothetical protein